MVQKSEIKIFSHGSIALGFLLVFCSSAFSSSGERDSLSIHSGRLQLEVQDDAFVPSISGERVTSPAFKFSHFGFFATQVNVSDSGMNIVGDAANEPSIAVDPTNPLKMSIGWRQFNTISSNFRQAGHAYTTDGGHTWTFPGVLEPGIFRSDPVFDSDAEGNFYYNSLTVVGSDYRCDVFKSTDFE